MLCSTSLPRFGRLLLWVITGLMATGVSAAPEDDLRMSFSSEPVAGTPGMIVGRVLNISGLTYPCVDAVFQLVTSFADRQAGHPVRELGLQRVRLYDVQSRVEQEFRAPLERRAGFGFKGYELCAEPVSGDAGAPRPVPVPRPDPAPGPAPVPQPPQQARFCDINGRIASVIDFQGLDDRGQRVVIDRVYVLDASDQSFVAEARLDRRFMEGEGGVRMRGYALPRLPEGQRYLLRLGRGWITEPAQVRFTCPDAQGRTRFGLPQLLHVRSQLGG